jgi:hypothetical protein
MPVFDGAPARPISVEQTYELRLYVAGQTPKSVLALANLRQICEQHLHGRYTIEVIDLIATPQLAQGDQILAARSRTCRRFATSVSPGATTWKSSTSTSSRC